jgi:hypothetical protein
VIKDRAFRAIDTYGIAQVFPVEYCAPCYRRWNLGFVAAFRVCVERSIPPSRLQLQIICLAPWRMTCPLASGKDDDFPLAPRRLCILSSDDVHGEETDQESDQYPDISEIGLALNPSESK